MLPFSKLSEAKTIESKSENCNYAESNLTRMIDPYETVSQFLRRKINDDVVVCNFSGELRNSAH